MRSRSAEVALTRRAERDLDKLSDDDAARALAAIRALQNDPLLGKPLKGRLKRARRLDFGLSAGWYRAAYTFLPDLGQSVVFMVAPRGGFYEEAERRYKALRTT